MRVKYAVVLSFDFDPPETIDFVEGLLSFELLVETMPRLKHIE